jgi:hypothetical protein
MLPVFLACDDPCQTAQLFTEQLTATTARPPDL